MCVLMWLMYQQQPSRFMTLKGCSLLSLSLSLHQQRLLTFLPISLLPWQHPTCPPRLPTHPLSQTIPAFFHSHHSFSPSLPHSPSFTSDLFNLYTNRQLFVNRNNYNKPICKIQIFLFMQNIFKSPIIFSNCQMYSVYEYVCCFSLRNSCSLSCFFILKNLLFFPVLLDMKDV